MNVVVKTLEENYLFYARELARVDGEIAILPRGSISAKRIGGATYHYRQWREGKRVVSVSLGRDAPAEVLAAIARRKELEGQRAEILASMAAIARAVDARKVTAVEIAGAFAGRGVPAMLVGSCCLPVMREGLGWDLPTVRTVDVDFLVDTPYRGRAVDVDAMLRPLGFRREFREDGSTIFSNAAMSVEFITPERGRGRRGPVPIGPMGVSAVARRYVQMLLVDTIRLEIGGHALVVPSPWALAFHKLIVADRRSRAAASAGKRDKDIQQAVALLREIARRPEAMEKARAYLGAAVPARWRAAILRRARERLPGGAWEG